MARRQSSDGGNARPREVVVAHHNRGAGPLSARVFSAANALGPHRYFLSVATTAGLAIATLQLATTLLLTVPIVFSSTVN